ncbi:MAG TPA: hypothetical protein VHZ55_24710, partial [Bryobacteraceae bacterium]|nr:hypothetical protein [Bryobacteraceae bacterium]
GLRPGWASRVAVTEWAVTSGPVCGSVGAPVCRTVQGTSSRVDISTPGTLHCFADAAEACGLIHLCRP